MAKSLIEQLKAIKKFIIDDFKSDLNFIGWVIEGKFRPKINKDKVKELFDLEAFVKENWLMFFVIAFAFVCGLFYGSQYYQDKCNIYIQEHILPEVNQQGCFDIEEMDVNITEEVKNTPSPNKGWLDNLLQQADK
jgi:hypothetical protein